MMLTRVFSENVKMILLVAKLKNVGLRPCFFHDVQNVNRESSSVLLDCAFSLKK